MKFRTEIDIKPYPFRITRHDRILLIGSCFSDHIGNFFSESGFTVMSNPFGVLFNPYSIETGLRLGMDIAGFTDSFIHYHDNRWISFAHHGRFSHSDKDVFMENIRSQLAATNRFLQEADYIFITFGTAYYYRFSERNIVVSNCHKIPADEFKKERMEIPEIVTLYRDLIERIAQGNPKVKFIFTVSPVRHLGDGFHENLLSKSILHLAIDQLANNCSCFYFPSYEILMDDLRDYRFYAKDLCHPGEQAIDYIREKVKSSFFSDETRKEVKLFEKENKRKGHIPLR